MDDRYGERHEEKVGNDVACTHRNQLRISLSTFRSRVWHHLPVMRKGVAFCQSRHDHSNESDAQKVPDEL